MSNEYSKWNILVIEDDKVLNDLLSKELSAIGYGVFSARCWRDAETYLTQNEPDLILLDIRLPDADGMEVIPKLTSNHPVIVLTAYGSIENAVRAVKSGAVEYLSKPINLQELELQVKKTLENAQLRRDYQFVKEQQKSSRKTCIVGNSKLILDVMKLTEAVAVTDTTVLIQGESGVGKELVAREIHQRSPRNSNNFVALDCCTLHENLFESELFGYEKGAFTGAVARKRGLIEGANGGTVFLDEIGEISLVAQAKLLRVIETGQFRRLGGVKDLVSNARLVAATNCDLTQLCVDRTFRLDLYYRLNAFMITVPPLRDRREDIKLLAYHFLANHDFSRRIAKEFSRDAMHALVEYNWPGNIRELRNVIERAIILSGDEEIIHSHHLGLPSGSNSNADSVKLSFDYEPTLEEVKQHYVESLAKKYSGHRAKLASSLGVSERNVYRLLEKYGLRHS